jgi:hypothetical protein
MTPQISPRHALALRLADFIIRHNLTNPFGGDVDKDGRSYGILFARPRTLDGLVQVYGPQFILVQSSGPFGDGSHVFASEEHALAYLKSRFVDLDYAAANAIPRKPQRQATLKVRR